MERVAAMAIGTIPKSRWGAGLVFGSAGLVVVGLTGFSIAANIFVWWATGADLFNRLLFTGVGFAAEIWGFLGLIIITTRWVRGEWLRAGLAVALWVPAIFFNAFTIHRFLEMSDQTHQRAAVEMKASRDLVGQEITDLQQRIDAAAVTRSITAIETELALVPEESTRRIRALSEELQRARDVDAWRQTIATKRRQLAASAGDAGGHEAEQLGNEWIKTAIAIWIEAMKVFGLWVLRGRIARREEGGAAPLTQQQPAPAPYLPHPPRPITLTPNPTMASLDESPAPAATTVETGAQTMPPNLPLRSARRRAAATDREETPIVLSPEIAAWRRRALSDDT
jgi:hypothetical protein